MKMTPVAATELLYQTEAPEDANGWLPDTAELFASHAAAICYSEQNFEAVASEPIEKTLKRIAFNIKNGHHSVMDHYSISFYIENCPKFFAMMLNNEKVYGTSEKSGRYTTMQTEGLEKQLYDKWTEKYETLIEQRYPNLPELQRHKLALENARYIISIFTPSTSLLYTTNYRQWRYLLKWSQDIVNNPGRYFLGTYIMPYLQEFISALKDYGITPLDDGKERSFSIFGKRDRSEEFGETYCTTYAGSFALLAQEQRHRTLSYELTPHRPTSFYVPPILQEHHDLVDEWLGDLTSVANFYPQGMLININERGTVENFLLKCGERLCGSAQLEICQQTVSTYKDWLWHRPDLVLKYAPEGTPVARCQAGFQCHRPCYWGGKHALERMI